MEGLSEPCSLYPLPHFKVLLRALVRGGGQARQHGQPSSRKSPAVHIQLDSFWLSCNAISVTLDLHSHLRWHKDDAVGRKYSCTTMTTGRCPKRPINF